MKVTGKASKRAKRKARGGRPSLGAATRNHPVQIKVTDAEHAAVQKRVKGSRGGVAGWFREHGLTALGKKR